MNNNWKSECESLNRFVSENPEIVLSTAEVSIPQAFREEFYRRFDRIRAAFVDAHYSQLAVDPDSLSRQFLQIEKEVLDLLRVEKISMPVDLLSFLRNPREGLTRILYNRLFDLLQGKIKAEEFEEQAIRDLEASSSELYRLGYEWWAGLAVIKNLEPDESFFVDFDEDYKPVLTELKEISFGRQAHHPTIRIPEFVLHSKKLGKYVAVKMAIAKELETYVVPFKPPVRPKKRTGDTSSALDSRVMLVTFLRDKDSVPIIADIYERTLNSPDWMVECLTGDEYQDPATMEQVKLHVNSLNPTRGLCLIVMGRDPSEVLEAEMETIRPVSIGFDQSKLQSVISQLA